jgi:Outer membrane protein beta-barrel domain
VNPAHAVILGEPSYPRPGGRVRPALTTALGGLLLVCASASSLPAQTRIEPRLYLTVLGGYRAGRPLWTLHNQPFAVLVPGTINYDTAVVASPGLYDTLDLQRELAPAFVVGVSGTYFPGPHLGFQGEVAFLDFLGSGEEGRCAIRQAQPPYPGDLDPALCASLDRQTVSTGAVSVSVGVVGRLTPGRGVFPYVRAGAGALMRSHGTIEMVGVYQAANGLVTTLVVSDPRSTKTAFHFAFGAGVAVSMGTGYQLWLEGRDVIAQLDLVNGAADPSGASGVLVPPHGSRLLHNFILAVGLDVVFEKQRHHRY